MQVELLSPPSRRARLLAWKNVELVLDIGANEGQYAQRLRGAGYGGRIVSFEPGSEAFAGLLENSSQDPLWDCHQVALGESDAAATLNVALDTEGSSLLQVESREVRNSPGSRFVAKERVRMARLDSILDEPGLDGAPAYLKLDTQGTELRILEGGRRSLQSAVFVESELSLVPLYRGGPLFDEILDFLRGQGLALIAVEGIDEEHATGHMLQFDGIFLRTDD